MKIAIVGLRLGLGMRLIADSLLDALPRLGHEVVFIGDAALPLPKGVRGAAVAAGSSYGRMALDTLRPSLYRRALAFLERERPSLIYFTSAHPANPGLAWRAKRRVRDAAGRPPLVAMHLHDPVPHPGLARVPIYASQHLSVRFADRVVVYGEELKRLVTRHYGVPPARVVSVLHWCTRPPRAAAPVAAPARWFSLLGRIEPYKGLDAFAEAARRVLASRPGARFYIGGAGDLAPYRAALAGLGDAVRVENRELSNDETDRVMQESWAVVLPYTSGTQSGVIPVAMSNACPVIVTRVGSLPELVWEGETGYVVAPRDPAALAERMLALLGDAAARERLGRACFSYYAGALRAEPVVADLLERLAR